MGAEMSDYKTHFADDATLERIAKLEAERDKLRAILQGVRWAITFEANADGGWGKRIDYALQEAKP